MNNLELGRYEHEQLLKNPEYRMMLMMEDLEYRMTPSLAQNELPEISHQVKPIIHRHIHLHIDKKALELQKRIVALEESLKPPYKKDEERFIEYTL